MGEGARGVDLSKMRRRFHRNCTFHMAEQSHLIDREQLETGTRPDFEASPSTESPPPLSPLFDHNPWADDLDPNPQNNFTTFEFTSNNGGGRISFSTRTIRRDVGYNVGLPARPEFHIDDATEPSFATFFWRYEPFWASSWTSARLRRIPW